MVFRRRTPRGWIEAAREAVWPERGYRRVWDYTKLRVQRLPDSPERIARGLAVGAFVSFTPFYGLHFLLAAGIAWAIRGNVVASIIGTFVNNFATMVPIAVFCVELGRWMLGMSGSLTGGGGRGRHGPGGPDEGATIMRLFAEAGGDIWHNIKAIFTPARTDWDGLAMFWDRILWPYTVGGVLSGLVVAVALYVVAVPLIRAFQQARRRAIARRQGGGDGDGDSDGPPLGPGGPD